MSDDMSDKITLKDVEAAIKIVELYLKHVEKARSILRRYQASAGHAYRRPEDIVAEVIAKDLASRAVVPQMPAKREEEEEEEIDVNVEEAINRLRQLAESEKASEKKKTSTGKQSS